MNYVVNTIKGFLLGPSTYSSFQNNVMIKLKNLTLKFMHSNTKQI